MWLVSREPGGRSLRGLLLPPFPTHLSHHTEHPGMSDREGEHRERPLRRNLIQSSWGAMRLTAAMRFHSELSVCWWNNEMKTVVQMVGASNDGVCGVFRGEIWLYIPLRTRTTQQADRDEPRLCLPPDLPASAPLGINGFTHYKERTVNRPTANGKTGCWHCGSGRHRGESQQ